MKCICQMCACGKHNCRRYLPQKHATTGNKEPFKLSEYQGEFKKGVKTQRTVFQKPTDCIKPEGVANFDTTHQANYPPREVVPIQKKKVKERHITNDEPMQSDTEYGVNYLKGRGEIIPLPKYFKKKTQLYDSSEGPINDSVTHSHFHEKKITDERKVYKLKDSHVVSDAPFDGKSIHHTDYHKFNEPPSKTGRRPDNIDMKGQPMYYDTTTKTHFPQYNEKAVFQKPPDAVYEPNPDPFDGTSIMKADYGVHRDHKIPSVIKHDNLLFATNNPLQKGTTNMDVYKNWGYQKRNVEKDPAMYSPPSANMESQRTSDDYKNFVNSKPSKSLRPKTHIKVGGDFEGQSMYKKVFVEYDVSLRAKPFSKEATCYSSGVPFVGTSESKDHYKKFDVAPAEMIKRLTSVFNRNAPFDGRTSYELQYPSKKLPDCLSSKIVSNNFKGYNVVDDVDAGHCFLTKVDASVASNSAKSSHLPPIDVSNGNVVTVN